MGTFDFINDGLDDNSFVDEEGDRWFTDEYGDKGDKWTTWNYLVNGFRWTVQTRSLTFSDRRCRSVVKCRF